MNTTRRKFIKNSTLAASGIGLASALPGSLYAMNRGSANDKIVIGLIGCNGMGFADLKAFLRQPNVECAMLCDVDRNVLEERAEQTSEIQGKKPKLVEDFREVIDNKDIDAVIIGTPDHWHCLPMVYACEAGKDVYVEKPLANTIQECNIMLKAARKYDRVVQVGQWQRSDPHWKTVVDYVHSGKLGRIRTVKVWAYIGWKDRLPYYADEPVPEGVNYDFWLGPAPKRPFNRHRFHFTFRWFWDYAGGLMTDWGVHLLDYALFGMNKYAPDSVIASGGKFAFPEDQMETPDTLQAIYDFGEFGLLWDHTIGIYGGPFQKEHGVSYIGEHGTLQVDRDGWQVLPDWDSKGNLEMDPIPYTKRTGDASGLDMHVENFLKCMKTREKPNADVEIGAHIAKIAHLGNIAYKTGRKVYWDVDKNEFKGDEKANEYIYAHYRSPWELPKI
ncbi:MAG: Gfo/Idh/MocA family oxidoreductase [Bacteroidales bacterium]|nr:Gfo/Idh/MocA family oxidoreductase [Bacteroidales bacterium]